MAGKRFAAIDIGTNTILLLIVELRENGSFSVLEDRAEIPRLGEGVDRARLLGLPGQERSLQVLRGYVKRCSDLAAEEIAVVGTSALRDARNREEFKTRLKRELGLELRVLSGEEEASYSYLAVEKGLELGAEELLVVDIGGGSTELIWGRRGKLDRWASLDIGSVRLTERVLRSDPVREEEYSKAIVAVDQELELLRTHWGNWARFDAMVGIAGTFTTLAAVAKRLKPYSHSEVHGSRLSRAEVARQIELLKSTTIAGRKEIPGLEPERADVIFAGAMLVQRIMTLFSMEEVVVSDQGIRYGLLHERLATLQG